MKIGDITGKILQRRSMKLSAGENTVQLNSKDFTNEGVYIVHLTIGGKTYTQRLILTR